MFLRAGSFTSIPIGAIGIAAPVPTVPPADWRMPATVTLSAGDPTAINAAQATAAAKTRPAIAIAASSVHETIYQVASHDTDLILSVYSARLATYGFALHTSPDGVAWTAIPFTKVYPSGDGPANRRQAKLIPSGPAKYIRLTTTADGTASSIYPLLHKKPSSGPWDCYFLMGASREDELLGTFSGGNYQLEAAIKAAYPDRDPIIINWAVGGADLNGITFTAINEGIPGFTGICSQAYAGSISGNYITVNKPFVEGQRSYIETRYNNLVAAFVTAGMDAAISNTSFRLYTGVTPEAQAGGSLEYNNDVIHALIASLTPKWWNPTDGRPYIDEYLAVLYDRAGLEDSTHGSPTGDANMRVHKVQYYFGRIYSGAFPAAQAEQRVATFETTPTNANYLEATYAMNGFAVGAPKTTYQARIDAATTLPAATGTPVLSDTTPADGDVLGASGATWSGVPTPVIFYDWITNTGSPANAANAGNYSVATADIDKMLKRRETGTNVKGSSFVETAFSSAVAAGGGGPSLLPQTTALLARMTSAPDSALTTKIDTLMNVVVTLNLEHFVMYGLHDSQASLLDWNAAANNHALTGATMTHTPGAGFTGTGTGAIAVNRTQAQLWSTSSNATLGIGVRTLGTGTILGAAFSGASLYLVPDVIRYFQTSPAQAVYTWSAGNHIVTRIVAGSFTAKKNTNARLTLTGTSAGLASPSGANPPTINRANTAYGTHTYSHFFACHALTEAEEDTLNTAIAAFLA